MEEEEDEEEEEEEEEAAAAEEEEEEAGAAAAASWPRQKRKINPHSPDTRASGDCRLLPSSIHLASLFLRFCTCNSLSFFYCLRRVTQSDVYATFQETLNES
jgi:hypothetical protein